MPIINLRIWGMRCNSCKLLMTDILEENGSSNILIKIHEKNKIGEIRFEYSGNLKKIKDAIEKEGYSVIA